MSIVQTVRRWSLALVVCLTVMLIGVIGLLDYLTGHELSFFVFYFIPIALLALRGGRWFGAAGSVVTTAVWTAANLAAGLAYSTQFVLLWNIGARLITSLVLALLVSTMKETVVHFESLSSTDPLTGAANSRAFLEVLAKEIDRVTRYRRPLTLCYIDVDNFKAINDTFGHAAGDAALKIIVSTVTNSVRVTDVIARLGGDEFGLLLLETDQASAEKVVQKIRTGMQKEMRVRGWPASASVGSVTFRGGVTDPPIGVNELIKKADDLMYEAKAKGKDTASFSSLP